MVDVQIFKLVGQKAGEIFCDWKVIRFLVSRKKISYSIYRKIWPDLV